MNSILDSGQIWFLERLVYGERLEVYLVEGIRAPNSTDLVVGDAILSGTHALDITPASRRAVVIFDDVLAFLTTKESYAVRVDPATPDASTLRRHTQSGFLDSLGASTLLDALGPKDYVHFALALADDIIDVVSTSAPRVEELSHP